MAPRTARLRVPLPVWPSTGRAGVRRRGMSMLGALVVLVALAGGVRADSAPATAPVQDFEARLEALRNALVDTALAGETAVRSSAWLDQDGRLHESTHIQSGARVRGVRIDSYLDEAGLVEARVEAESVSYLPAETLFCGILGQGLRRQATLERVLAADDQRPGAAFAALLLDRGANALLRQSERHPQWVVDGAMGYASSYERLIAGTSADRSPYRMILSVGTDPRAASTAGVVGHAYRSVMDNYAVPRRTDAAAFTLALRVEERHSGQTVWQDLAALRLPQQTVPLGRTGLPPALAAEVDAVVAQWLAAIGHDLRCAPVYFSLREVTPESAQVNIGFRAGLKRGDMFVVADRTRLPGHVLEAGALESMVLMRVEAVAADASVLRRVAGPPVPNHPALVAMPL